MGDNKPIDLGDEPIKLKIPPKACELCGKPFIPTGTNAKFCPRCRELSQGKRERSLFSKHATMAFGHGPWSKDFEDVTESKSPTEYVASLAQAARFLFEIEQAYGFDPVVVRTSYEQVSEYGKRIVVPYVQLSAEQFYKVFGDVNYEYSYINDSLFIHKWFGGVMFEAMIPNYRKVSDLWTE